VGLCQFYKGWRFQLEGERCRDYAPVGESREVGEPCDLPEPKRAYDKAYVRGKLEANRLRIRRWNDEGKSFWWMASMIDIPDYEYQVIPRWLRREDVK